MDPFLAMMGQLPDEQEQIMMAQMLRGQAAAGGQLSTSSIAPVAKQGGLMQQQAAGQAEGVGLARYREKMLEEQAANREAANMRAVMQAQSRLAAAASKAKEKDYFKLSDSAAGKFQDKLEDNSAVKGLTARFQDDFAGSIPVFAEFENALSNRGIGTEGMRKQAQWWGDWKKYYENPVRHRLFGSALTTGEQQQWYASNINPNMKPDEIRRRLGVLDLMSKKVAAYEANLLMKRNIDPEYVRDAVSTLGIIPEDEWDDLPGYMNKLTKQIAEFDTPKDLKSMSLEELQEARRIARGGQ